MSKKYISIVLAALLVASSISITANAAVIETKASTETKGTFFFDAGDWGADATLCFYIWDGTTGECATKNGWVSDNVWGSAKKIGGTLVEGTKFESYEIDFTGKENDDLFVIFHDKKSGVQTFDTIINESVIGKTATRTGEMLENPVDSTKKAEGVRFDGGEGLGAAKSITSTGKIQGDVIPKNSKPEDIVANFVLNSLGKSDETTGEALVTAEKVGTAIKEFGTNIDDVWASYQKNEGAENYNAEEAEKVIKGAVIPEGPADPGDQGPKKGTFFFDVGDWGADATLCFYIWDGTTGECATKNGWVNDNVWGSAKKIGGTLVEGTKFESYEIDFTGKENDDLFVIFHDKKSGTQTFDTIINQTVIGKTATRTGEMLENPVDSTKKAEGVRFDGGEGLGAAKSITSTGKIQGDVIPKNSKPEDIVANFVLNSLGKTDETTGEALVTAQKVAEAMNAFGTNADAVWASYQKNQDNENYNVADAEKIIKDAANIEINPAVGGILGDVDGSEDIDSADSLLILRRSIKLEQFDANQEKLADVDKDGSVTANDALEVLRYSVELPTTYAIGEKI